VITSTRNPRVQAARGLHRVRERRTRGLHLVEGPRAVREALAAGRELAGPAICEQDDSTVVVPPEWRAEVQADGTLVLEREAEK